MTSYSTPRTHAIAYRIWADCEMWGWNRTIAEIAESVDEPYHTVRAIIGHRRWTGRIKSMQTRQYDVSDKLFGSHFLSFDVPVHMILEQYT